MKKEQLAKIYETLEEGLYYSNPYYVNKNVFKAQTMIKTLLEET